MHVFTSFVLFEGEKFHGGGRVWYFNVIWLKSIHTFTFIVTVFTASASIRVSSRNASLYIAVMIFCAQPYLKPCFMCPFYILSTCPSKGLCTALSYSLKMLLITVIALPAATVVLMHNSVSSRVSVLLWVAGEPQGSGWNRVTWSVACLWTGCRRRRLKGQSDTMSKDKDKAQGQRSKEGSLLQKQCTRVIFKHYYTFLTGISIL